MAEELRLPSYGGQALIEGVLMRGKHSLAAAFRKPDGEIVIETEELPAAYKGSLMKIPVLRGLLLLWDALGLGTRYLTKSANYQAADESEKIEGKSLFLTMGLSFAIGIGIFFLLPALVAHLVGNWINLSNWLSNLIEGLIRLLILIGYMAAVRKMPDIYRVFQYHGAEHKTINAYEARIELTPENLMSVSVFHPRCGTAFLLTLVIISILVFTLLGPMGLLLKLTTRVLLIPVLAGISYEVLRWTANHRHNPIVAVLIKPNLMLQKLTTAEPDASMLEVAIKSFSTMLALENTQDTI